MQFKQSFKTHLLLGFFLVKSAIAQGTDKYWIDVDYLLWKIKENPVPAALVTKADFSDALPGAIGQPHTRVVLGKKSVDMEWMQGFELGAGAWLKQNIGLQASFFLLPSVSKSKHLKTSGQPGSANYAVPIFDVTGVFGLNGVPGETIFILPGPDENEPGFFGDFTLLLKSELQGAELNTFYRSLRREHFVLDWIFGVRWIDLHEKFLFKARTHAASGSSFGNAFYNFKDRFETTNHFLAGQVGMDARFKTKRWHLDALLKGELGATLEKLEIHGSSRTSGGNLFFLTEGTANETLAGGVFAEPSNRGSRKKSRFAWGIESKIRAGVDVTKTLELHLGYSFLWISKVLRPGDQIDRKINSTRTALADASRATVGVGPGPVPFGGAPAAAPLPRGSKRPKPLFKTSSFWAQGLDVGVEFHF